MESKKRKYELRSWVWNFCSPIDGNTEKALCSLCSKLIKCYNTSTSELIKHLSKEHKVYENSSVSEVLSRFGKSNLNSESSDDEIEPNEVNDENYRGKSKAINDQLVRFIVKNNLSFQLVDDTEFIKLVNLVNKKYKLPCRQTLSARLVPNMVKLFL